MAASPLIIDYNLKKKPNQFGEIYAIVQESLKQGTQVILILDIDGVQDEARLNVEDVLKKYLEKDEAFKEYIRRNIVPSVAVLCPKFGHSLFPHNTDPLKSLIEYMLLPGTSKKEFEALLQHLQQQVNKDHTYYLSYYELLKALRTVKSASEKVGPFIDFLTMDFPELLDLMLSPHADKKRLEELSQFLKQSDIKKRPDYLSYDELFKALKIKNAFVPYDIVMEQITEKIISNTALICTMHLSTAICATSPLFVSDKSEKAFEHLAKIYQDFQHGNSEKNNSYVIQLTARTEAMTAVFARLMLSQGITLLPLEKPNLVYTYNAKRFRAYPTGVIPRSNIIAASRNAKAEVVHEFLVQNGLLSEQKLLIIHVDDKEDCQEDIKNLTTLPDTQNCTIQTVLFDRNRSNEEKQELCALVAENLQQKGLIPAIREYQETWTNENNRISDLAASAVVGQYILDLMEKDIISQDKIVHALNPTKHLQHNILSPSVWSNANQSTHFSLSLNEKDQQQQPNFTDAPQPR